MIKIVKMKQIIIDGTTYNLVPVEESKTEKPTKEERFKQLIEGVDISHPVVDFEKYPDSMFWFKGDKFLFEYDFKNKRLWVQYDEVWKVFESEYNMIYDDIQLFMKGRMEEHFKLKDVEPDVISWFGGD